MSDLVMRQLAMLKLIPKRGGGVSTAEIEQALDTEGFVVSRRTIQRDLEKLSTLYPLTCMQEGRANLWRFAKGADPLMIPGMDLNTALTLKLAQRHLSPLIPQRVRAFLEPYFPEADKVLSSHPSKYKSWTDKTRAISLGIQQLAPEIDEAVWEVMTQAIIDQARCEVTYQGHRSDHPRRYCISPLAIVIRGPVTYLLAVYEGYSDIRQMAMHRFHQARVLVDDAYIPEGFDLDEYIQAGSFGILYDETPQPLVMTVTKGVARILQEAPLTEDQSLESRDDGVRVTCQLPESWDLYRWLLSHARDVRVESPVHIRDTLIQYLQQSLQQYQPETGSLPAVC